MDVAVFVGATSGRAAFGSTLGGSTFGFYLGLGGLKLLQVCFSRLVSVLSSRRF